MVLDAAVRKRVRAVHNVSSVNQPTYATVTFQMSLQVTDPELFLAWAAAQGRRGY
jgi:hypothetical protein